MSNDPGTDDLEAAVWQAGELLLNGWGFNWYRTENLLRADDLLVRNQADGLIGDALAALRRAEAVFRQKNLFNPSREKPVPDASDLAELRAFQSMLAELDELRTRLRGAVLPPEDKLWRRHRDEADLLERLGRCDAVLAGLAKELRTRAFAITPASLAEMPSLIGPGLRQFRAALEQRSVLLELPSGPVAEPPPPRSFFSG